MARGAHRGGDGGAANPDFQRLLDSDFVRHAFVFAIPFAADDAAESDPLHAKPSHERRGG
jgi:hypothetical protein